MIGTNSVASYAYQYVTNDDRIARITLSDGSDWKYQYDRRGHLTSGKRYAADGSDWFGRQFAYAYDSLGNTINAGPLTTAGTPRYSFVSSPFNVLTTNRWGSVIEVSGSAATNATVVVNRTRALRKDKYFWAALTVSNQLSAIEQDVRIWAARTNAPGDLVGCASGKVQVAQVVEVPSYNANLSLTHDSRREFTYNLLGWLCEVVNSAVSPQMRVTFDYYPDGRRACKTVYRVGGMGWETKEIHKFHYDGWNLVAEDITDWTVSPVRALTRYYTWGLDLAGLRQGRYGQDSGGIGGLLAITEVEGASTRIYYPLSDHNGNILKLVDGQTGSVVAEYDYDPFGVLLSKTGSKSSSCPFRFMSKYYDADLGLYYFGYRYYDPATTKWLTLDPLGEKGGINLTAFCRNDPVNYTDPLGLTAYAVYRQLGITGLGWTWYAGRLAGHVYLAFDDKNMGKAWQEKLEHHGYSKSDTPNPQNYKEYKDKITFSFHPWSVKTENSTGNRVSVVYTGGSWVDINNYEGDIRPIIKDKAIVIPLTTDEAQQIKLFEAAQQSANINRSSMTSADHENYSFAVNNCADWAKWITEQSGLSWPNMSYLWNVGTAVGGPLDYTCYLNSPTA